MQVTEAEQTIINKFLSSSFDKGVSRSLSDTEKNAVENCLDYVAARFGSMKYILGTALDFTLLAQRLSDYDNTLKSSNPDLTLDKIFSRYQVSAGVGERKANTLTLSYRDKREGIRRIEESVVELFHSLNRSGYPSAYVYNTGQWQKYRNLLLACFQLSEPARLLLCERLIAFGLANLPKNSFYARETLRVRLFEEVIENYERGVQGENGGLIFQAIAYGYIAADRPHLSIIADKVRTGSARQKRFGDIDCYFGLDLETSIEVKDIPITTQRFEKELGEFCRKCEGNNTRGIAFILDVDERTIETITSYGVNIITQAALLYLVSFWDWPKQDAAVQGMLHYLSHIEQDPNAVRRLLTFINQIAKNHDSLVYFTD